MAYSVYNGQKTVTIIVPVYNAERWLGYCLNSILSQTYGGWNAILVNDGSTDGSLRICEQYAALDSRFQVITKENGGVSSARNVGLALAAGDYLEFLDSDDCLSSDALSTQLLAAEEYGCNLVMTDIMTVDFSNPDGPRGRLTSEWLGAGQGELSAQEFREVKMQLIWHTAMLECLHGKLYDRAIWEAQKLRFPEDVSLGEDFLVNLRYYDSCGKVVFLPDCCHYYNCITGSGSLTQKYRPNLLQERAALTDALRSHLGSDLSAEEQDALWCYTASNGLHDLETVALRSGATGKALLRKLEDALNDSFLLESLRNASYIPERYQLVLPALRHRQVLPFILWLQKPDITLPIRNRETNREAGLVNRTLCKGLTLVRPAFGDSAIGSSLESLQEDVSRFGMVGTVRRRWDRKRGFVAAEPMEETPEEIPVSQPEVESQSAEVVSAVIDSALRTVPKVFLLGSAEHTNIGDAAISLAAVRLLTALYPDRPLMEISTYEFSRQEAWFRAVVHPGDVFFFCGGGNLGDRYPAEENLRRTILRDFPDHKVVILPQTISFASADELETSAQLYRSHRDLTVFVRGTDSFRTADQAFSPAKTTILPDLAQLLNSEYHYARHGILLFLRNDSERVISDALHDTLQEIASCFDTTERIDNVHTEDISRLRRTDVVFRQLMRIAHSRVVVTDRLHGMIFAVLTNTPCVVLSSCDHKLQEYRTSFLDGCPGIHTADTTPEAVQAALEKALSVSDCAYPDFSGHLRAALRDVLS